MTLNDLQQRLAKLQKQASNKIIANDPVALQNIQDEIAKTEQEIQTMQNAGPGNGNTFINAMLSTIASQMAQGTGLDSPAVRQIIKEYLKKDKIQLDELGQSVLEEIKKNQTVYLQIPELGKPIAITKDQSDIPNFYSIIDDVLAGNNVFLIGEAGGGKTYTAQQIAAVLERPFSTINCSQYTSPLEVLGGQSIEGFKQGKLIDAWRNGKILIIDEMPKLDPNTAGLFNDALAKSTKTTPNDKALINSANPDEGAIERNSDFAVIATGNIYPNEPPAPQYRGNSQQDLSLLDRFSGSVYYVEFDQKTDEKTTRFKFLYDFLVGNYHEYIEKKRENKSLPTPIGLRTVIESLNFKNMALVSYRTNIAFRVAFEFQLVRHIMENQGVPVTHGKTFLGTFHSYMVAFGINSPAYNSVIKETKFTDQYITQIVNDAIEEILKNDTSFLNALNPLVAANAAPIFKSYKDFYVANTVNLQTP